MRAALGASYDEPSVFYGDSRDFDDMFVPKFRRNYGESYLRF